LEQPDSRNDDDRGRARSVSAEPGGQAEGPGVNLDAVCQYGDAVLRRKARPVRRINAGIRELAGRMVETMYAANGVGLAAPQIGVDRRLVVIDVGDGPVTLVNPRLIWSEGAARDVEGCLSVKGLIGDVERAERVRVRALDLDGKEVTVEGEGLLARVLQHELDHLDGVLFVDRATGVREAEQDEGAGREVGTRDGTDGDPGGDPDGDPGGDPGGDIPEAVPGNAGGLR